MDARMEANLEFGQAVVDRFHTLEQLLESAVKMVKLKGAPEFQMAGFLTYCEELQRILKIALLENGFLANKIDNMREEYDSKLAEYEKRMDRIEQQNKSMTSHIVKVHSKLHRVEKKSKVVMKWMQKDASTNTLPLNMGDYNEDWVYSKLSSDYETLSFLETPNLNLDVMLRFNTMLVSFLEDESREHLYLPMIGPDERSELSKLASAYKIRCRFGKETKLASVTLIKVRQSCLPAHGEVDSILTKYVCMGESRSMRSQSTRKAEVKGKSDVKQNQAHSTPVSSQSKVEAGSNLQPKCSSPTNKTIKSTSKQSIVVVPTSHTQLPSSHHMPSRTSPRDPRQQFVWKSPSYGSSSTRSVSPVHTPLYCKETSESLPPESENVSKVLHLFPSSSQQTLPQYHHPRIQHQKDSVMDIAVSLEHLEEQQRNFPFDGDGLGNTMGLFSADRERIKGRKSSTSKQRQLFIRVQRNQRDSSDTDSPEVD